MMSDTLAIVVTYNPDLAELIPLVNQIVSAEVDLIVIDNASLNQNLILRELSYTVKFVQLPENIGLPAAQNHAISLASGKHHKWLVFFDQDTHLSPDFIGQLFAARDEISLVDNKFAAVGPSLIDKRSGIAYSPESSDVHFVPSHFLISSGMLVSSDAFKAVGGVCSDFFIDYFDLDLSFRLRATGFSIYRSNKVFMHHSVADKTLNFFGRHVPIHAPLRKFYQARNLLWLYKRNPQFSLWFIRELLSATFNNILYIFYCRQPFLAIYNVSRGIFYGLISKAKSNEIS